MKFLINNYAYAGIVGALKDRGHEVLGMNGSVDEFNWWQHLINEGNSNEDYDVILRAQVEEHKPDVYLCGKGWHADKWIKPETTEWIRSKVGCTVYWSLDDPDFVPMHMRFELWRGYDVALSCCRSSLKEYESKGLEAHLFWPAWDQVERSPVHVAEEDKACDFLLVGTPYTVTRPARRWVALAMLTAGLDVHIYGSDAWKRFEPDNFAAGWSSLVEHYRGHFSDWSRVHELFASARVNFSNHLHRADAYLNDRVPMVLGTGGFLVMDRQPGVDEWFIDAEDLVYYDDAEDLVEKVVRYAREPEERARIGANGMLTVQLKHTYEHRVEQLLGLLAVRGLK